MTAFPGGVGTTFDFQKYTSETFLGKDDVNYNEVTQVLKKIRLSNVNRVIIGHLNVNFFAPKFDAIKTIIPGNVDIMIFGETKLDSTYPTAQFMIDGFKKPFDWIEPRWEVGFLFMSEQIYLANDLTIMNFLKKLREFL